MLKRRIALLALPCLLALGFALVGLITGSASADPAGYTYCASEHSFCSFAGTKWVIYGAQGVDGPHFTAPRQFTDGVQCDNSVFGDPWVGVAKYCDTADVTPTTTTASTTTTPSGPCSPLAWAPPTLTSPVTMTVPATGGTLTLNTAQDYILQAPNVITAPVTISGGHNIVWIGATFRYPSGNGATWTIKFIHNAGNGGTIHLEGFLIDGANGFINDGIVGGQYGSDSKPAGTLATTTLQIENWRETIRGNWATNHDDIFQQYGGWHELRIDCLSGTTEGQGFYLPYEDSASSNQGVLSRWDARNFNLADSASGQAGETLLHFGDKSGSFNATTHRMTCNISNGWINGVLRTFDQETYPNSGTNSTDGTVVHSVLAPDGLSTSWATTWNCPGSLNKGVPPGGDFVPASAVGIGYISPGYGP